METAGWAGQGCELLPTGSRWAGPIGTCDIVITLDWFPPGNWIVTTLPVATSHEGHERRWHFDGILPGTQALPGVAVFWQPGPSPHLR